MPKLTPEELDDLMVWQDMVVPITGEAPLSVQIPTETLTELVAGYRASLARGDFLMMVRTPALPETRPDYRRDYIQALERMRGQHTIVHGPETEIEITPLLPVPDFDYSELRVIADQLEEKGYKEGPAWLRKVCDVLDDAPITGELRAITDGSVYGIHERAMETPMLNFDDPELLPDAMGELMVNARDFQLGNYYPPDPGFPLDGV